jgi:hypothetical protein
MNGMVRLRRAVGAIAVTLVLLVVLGNLLAPARARAAATTDLQITVSVSELQALTGDTVSFTSTITNTSSAASPKLFANLNFVAVDHSTYVDPEDWSSERTISVPSLAAGASATHTWTIDTVTKGDVDAYVVALPDAGPTATAEPLISSPAVHLHVTEQRKLNPGGVLPVVLIVPGAIAAGFVGLQASRRRR